MDVTRQTEHLLRDDVALDREGASSEGQCRREEVAVVPDRVRVGELARAPRGKLMSVAPLRAPAGMSAGGPDPSSIPAAPARSLASSITCWPCSSPMIFCTEASSPGVRPWSRALSVRSRLSRSTSASMWSAAMRWRMFGSVIGGPDRTRSMSCARPTARCPTSTRPMRATPARWRA